MMLESNKMLRMHVCYGRRRCVGRRAAGVDCWEDAKDRLFSWLLILPHLAMTTGTTSAASRWLIVVVLPYASLSPPGFLLRLLLRLEKGGGRVASCTLNGMTRAYSSLEESTSCDPYPGCGATGISTREVSLNLMTSITHETRGGDSELSSRWTWPL